MNYRMSVLVAAVAGLALGACDLTSKDIGTDDPTGTSAGGGVCTVGDEMPADDGCNTCVCEEGGLWACTEIGCEDTGGPGATGGGDAADGGECTPGDTKDADDGCNTCSCDESGIWACTLLGCAEESGGGACIPGDTTDADDGCNTCECSEDGVWSCTEIACGGFPTCVDSDQDDPFSIIAAEIVGDQLNTTVSYSGGCAEHTFNICSDGMWAESRPVQTTVTIKHTDPGDVCDAVPSEDVTFDLLSLRQDYAAMYGAGPGTITINLDDWGSIDYAFR